MLPPGVGGDVGVVWLLLWKQESQLNNVYKIQFCQDT